jgi:TolA-binding protein
MKKLKSYDLIPFTAIGAMLAIAVVLAVTSSAMAQSSPEQRVEELTSIKGELLYIKLFLNDTLPSALGQLLGQQDDEIRELKSRIDELEYQLNKPKKSKFKAEKFKYRVGPIS